MRKFEEVVGSLAGIALICFLLHWFGSLALEAVTIHEVETYSFHATITDKAIVDEYRQPREYLLFFVDGEEAGAVDVMAHEYARYAIGDMILVNATVAENYHDEWVFYDLGLDN